MKEKNFSICLLYDIYAPLLTEKKRMAFELSYWQDLSLSEIAEHTGTTRQGVSELIKRTCEELESYESAMGIKRTFDALSSLSESIKDTSPDISEAINIIIGGK